VGCSNGQEPFALSLMSHRRGAGEKREKQTKSTRKIIGGGPGRTVGIKQYQAVTVANLHSRRL
jgi:hypothetical protein